MMCNTVDKIKDLILAAGEKARLETGNEAEPELSRNVQWPVTCTVGPGLEGAIACESKIGYVHGAKGWLIYRGYDIFELCAYSTFEEVSFLLMHGHLPNSRELELFKNKLIGYRKLNKTLRWLLGFDVEAMNAMAALRMGTNFMRQEFTYMDQEGGRPTTSDAISSDEDSIPMETLPRGEERAIYEFKDFQSRKEPQADSDLQNTWGVEACYHLISGVATIAAAIARNRKGLLPLEPDPSLGHAANFLYMINGRKPTPVEERVMDIALILHADHGMNASTFASVVTASTLADVYLSVGSGIAALSGPLHGGATEEVIKQLKEIGDPAKVKTWVDNKLAAKKKISGFGHRVYKAYDPRARVLGPLAECLSEENAEARNLFNIASALEKEMAVRMSREKKIFPNVDFYSGIVYSILGIDPEIFTPIFAVSRVAGWTARVLEYLSHNRIFRPRAIYSGEFNKKYAPVESRG